MPDSDPKSTSRPTSDPDPRRGGSLGHMPDTNTDRDPPPPPNGCPYPDASPHVVLAKDTGRAYRVGGHPVKVHIRPYLVVCAPLHSRGRSNERPKQWVISPISAFGDLIAAASHR